MDLPIPRIHFYEIDDQPWFPSFLRARVQATLTMLWLHRFPPFQSTSPAALIVRSLRSVLGPSIADYTFIDLCSGAGGPTPEFEREINSGLELDAIQRYHMINGSRSGRRKDANAPPQSNTNEGDGGDETKAVDFILTDLHPHIPSWQRACASSPHLHYIPTSIDATSLPPSLLSLAEPPLPSTSSSPRKPFHLFSLSFHHFPSPLAAQILHSTLTNSSGFAILELQSRSLGSLFTVLCMGPLLMAVSWYQFWGDWTHLFWTYVVPVVPVVVVLDGLMSCLRTRRRGEVLALIESVDRVEGRGWREGWRFESGRGVHTWPRGEANWFVGFREG